MSKIKETLCLVSVPLEARYQILVPAVANNISAKEGGDPMYCPRQYYNFYTYLSNGSWLKKSEGARVVYPVGFTRLLQKLAWEAYPEGTNIKYELIFE